MSTTRRVLNSPKVCCSFTQTARNGVTQKSLLRPTLCSKMSHKRVGTVDDGCRQLPWPVDGNYVGRSMTCSGQVQEAGLPLNLRTLSKVGDMPGKRITGLVPKYKQLSNQSI